MSAIGHWVFAPRARRDFRRLDRQVQRRITEALDRLVEDPPRGDVRKLTGTEEEWRLRVGDWRARFSRDPQRNRVEILRVLPRGRAYRD